MPIANLELIHSELFRTFGITAFFTERQGGVSKAPFDSLNFGSHIGDNERSIATNMERLIAHTRLTSQPHQAKQEHGIHHIICHGAGHLHKTSADILISQSPNCPIAIRTADCLPILLADPIEKIVAAVHAGWRGTAKRVVIHAVMLMQQHGASLKNIHASFGPSIGPCCFEVQEDVEKHLSNSHLHASNVMQKRGKTYADLASINLLQLQEAGICSKQIELNHACTACHPERFYSYRRDHGKTGRHLAVVALPEAI